jgi:phospholipid-transporting ATPase
MDGTIFCEAPNNAIYKFEGQFKLDGNDAIPLGADNIILRGCSLRNTEYVYGIVVFSGHDTKIMMNSSAAKYKFSGLEMYTNYAIIVVLITQFILASIGALTGTLWLIKNGAIHKDVENCKRYKDAMCESAFYIAN